MKQNAIAWIGISLLTLSAGIAAPATPATPATIEPQEADAAAQLHALLAEREAWTLHEFPERAMRRGIYDQAHRITDNSLAAIDRRHAETWAHLRRLRAIDRSALRGDDVLNYDLFGLGLDNAIKDHGFRDHLAPIGQRFGPHQTIPQMGLRVRFEQPEDYENYLTRLALAAASIDHTIERLQLGLDEGITPPRVALLGVPEQLAALVRGEGLADLATPLERFPAHFDAAQRETPQRRFQYQTLPRVRAALEKLETFFNETYLPGCRTDIAATARPQGAAFYAHQLRKLTTTELSADEIHRLGLAEVARIRTEMMDVIRRSDFLELHAHHEDADDDTLFAAFLDYLRSDPRFYFTEPEQLLTAYRDICKRVDAWLPKFFHTLPRQPYGVRAIPDFMAPHQTTAYYSGGTLANGEPGYFYANTYALDQRPKYEMIALAMHEAVPGHHLQSALAQELEDLPDFRRHGWYNAYGEGWALYSERLGIEMGLYDDPYDDFGRLLYEMWRACRLVVDPGMHALGWSRERAIEFMTRNTALSELNIKNEIDRYIAWPGQACGYKLGELRIRALRTRAEEKLGRQFDIREFHDVVLGAGSVPLTVLERRVNAWMRKGLPGAAYD